MSRGENEGGKKEKGGKLKKERRKGERPRLLFSYHLL